MAEYRCDDEDSFTSSNYAAEEMTTTSSSSNVTMVGKIVVNKRYNTAKIDDECNSYDEMTILDDQFGASIKEDNGSCYLPADDDDDDGGKKVSLNLNNNEISLCPMAVTLQILSYEHAALKSQSASAALNRIASIYTSILKHGTQIKETSIMTQTVHTYIARKVRDCFLKHGYILEDATDVMLNCLDLFRSIAAVRRDCDELKEATIGDMIRTVEQLEKGMKLLKHLYEKERANNKV